MGAGLDLPVDNRGAGGVTVELVRTRPEARCGSEKGATTPGRGGPWGVGTCVGLLGLMGGESSRGGVCMLDGWG